MRLCCSTKHEGRGLVWCGSSEGYLDADSLDGQQEGIE